MRDERGTEEDGRAVTRRRVRWGIGLVGLPIAATVAVGVPGLTTAAAGGTPALGLIAEQAPPPGTGSVDAFLAAGYTYDDALALAERWGPENELQIKTEVGELLARGGALTASRFADPAAADGLGPDQLAAAFTTAGYDGDDAAVLARAWGTDLAGAAERAGRELVVIGALPFVDLPVAEEVYDPALSARYQAFFAAGYDFDDAVLLAVHWGLGEDGFAEAKAQAGGLLLAGEPLPDVPGVAAS